MLTRPSADWIDRFLEAGLVWPWMRGWAKRGVILLAVGLFGGLIGRSGVARADDPVQGDYRLDLKLGPSMGIVDSVGTQFRVGLHFGMAVAEGPRYRVLFEIPPSIGAGATYTSIVLLPGFAVDIKLVSGMPFFIYPMVGAGVGVFLPSCINPTRPPGCATNIAFGLRMGAGVRYLLWGRWSFLFEPLNLEFFPIGSAGYTAAFYNMFLGAGVTF